MEKRVCENNGLELSVLGLGCWAFGGGEYWGKQNQADINRVVRTAWDGGINYFDTAEAYNEGRSESSLGEAIKDLPRNEIYIGTKISPSNCYYKTLIEHCHGSLRRLQSDYIDIYMIHWPIHPHSIKHFTGNKRIIMKPPRLEEAIEALRFLKEQGKIRFFAVSNFGVNRMKNLPLEEIAVNELPYNLLCRAIEFDVLPFCTKKGIGTIGYMALMQGLLADNFPTLRDVPAWRRRTRHFDSHGNEKCRHGEFGCEEKTQTALNQIRQICRDTGYGMADLSLKWIISNPDITCTLAGTTNVEKLEQNIKAVVIPLEKEIIKDLNRITSPVKRALGNHIDYYESAENDRTI